MHILVTGGTGFVGSHAAAALIHAGHDVRLLVRSRERVGPAFAALGVDPPGDLAEGDIMDAASVSAAIEGCEAVLHAASVFSFDPRKAAATRRTNMEGTRNVLDAAVAAGLDPIVHVSSYAALIPAEGGRLFPDAPPSTGEGAYSGSKADQERYARELQAQGHPAVTVMPGSVWGPYDPHAGESSELAIAILKGRMRMLSRQGGIPIVDVRDLGAAMARIFEPGQGPRRYLMAGQLLSSTALADLIGEVTGKRRRYLPVPAPLARQGGAAFDLLQRVSSRRLPLTRESTRIGTERLTAVDDSRAEQELGFTRRPIEETVGDTVRWLAEAGHVSRKSAGKLLASEAESVVVQP